MHVSRVGVQDFYQLIDQYPPVPLRIYNVVINCPVPTQQLQIMHQLHMSAISKISQPT